MDLYLMRHGIAEAWASSDASRALTPEGEKRVRAIARALVLEKDWPLPAKIISSDLKRAKETARIVQEVLDIKDLKEVHVDQVLTWPGMRAYIQDEPVLFVGHQPSLAHIIEDLSGKITQVKKGSIHRLDYDPLADRASYLDSLSWKEIKE